MTDLPEWVTIAQAAQILGCAERQARRVASRLPPADRRTDQTPSGRDRLTVRRSAIEERAAAPASSPDQDRPASGQATPSMHQAAERVIAEQAARIADLQRALDHEREQTQRLQDALAREQTLRALPAPAAEPNESEPPWWRRWTRRKEPGQ